MGEALEKLDELLMLLRAHGVDEFEDKGVKIKFGDHSRLRDPMIDNTLEEQEPEKKTTEDNDVMFDHVRGY